MEENTFWVSIWALAATVVISIVCSMCIYYTDVNAKILTAIKNGADPIEATCAFDSQYKQGICTLAASK